MNEQSHYLSSDAYMLLALLDSMTSMKLQAIFNFTHTDGCHMARIVKNMGIRNSGLKTAVSMESRKGA